MVITGAMQPGYSAAAWIEAFTIRTSSGASCAPPLYLSEKRVGELVTNTTFYRLLAKLIDA